MTIEKELYIDDEEPELTPYDNLGNDIYHSCPDMNDNYCGNDTCVTCLTRKLYELGYRRKDELLKEVFKDLDTLLYSDKIMWKDYSALEYSEIKRKYLGVF